MSWRADDEVLLQRLEDETIAQRLFALIVADRGDPKVRIHPRAGGLVGEVRKLPGGAPAVASALAGDVARLGRFIDTVPLPQCSPELLHHLALFHSKAATALESTAPDLAANSWVWSLAAWLALGEERAYISRLEEAVLGSSTKSGGIPPEKVPYELVNEIGRRADAASRDLRVSGTAALVALARGDDAARIAGLADSARQRLKVETNRRRNGAIESALEVIREGIDEASVQGDLTTKGRTLVLRAVAVWAWSGHDEQVEHFSIVQIERIGWELYRLRDWTSLRYLLDPFRPMMEMLAGRVERDPSQLAYAAGCAQMFVFMSDVDVNPVTKLAAAERSLKICPTHRNGRVTLASLLCDNAISLLRVMVVKKAEEVARAEAMIARAETLFPGTRELPEAKKKLEEVKARGLVIW